MTKEDGGKQEEDKGQYLVSRQYLDERRGEVMRGEG